MTVIEYASLGCPHCAWWAIEVFPRFKARYIDTGKVRLVFREVLFGDPALAAAGFLTARCAAPSEYFQVVDDVFREQDYLLHDGLIVLEQIAQRAGVDHARFQACLQDKAALASLQARSDGYVARDKVTGTPTFIIGEQRLEGAQTLDTLDAAILAAERQATTRRGGP